jgi:hypothetical protein
MKDNSCLFGLKNILESFRINFWNFLGGFLNFQVLLPPKDLQGKLDSESNNKTKVLEQVRLCECYLPKE